MSSPRVLVIDDNPMNVKLAEVVLSADGFEVASAAHAKAAMQRISEAPPDLILMDIQLPGVDGLELTRQLKSDPSTRHIVVVAFTAFAMRGDEQKMRAAGCDGYISKPIDVKQFAAQIRALLPKPEPESESGSP